MYADGPDGHVHEFRSGGTFVGRGGQNGSHGRCECGAGYESGCFEDGKFGFRVWEVGATEWRYLDTGELRWAL